MKIYRLLYLIFIIPIFSNYLLAQLKTNVEDSQFFNWDAKSALATKKTSTMEKEMNEGGEAGYIFVGVTVRKTLIGGSEVVVIMRKSLRL